MYIYIYLCVYRYIDKSYLSANKGKRMFCIYLFSVHTECLKMIVSLILLWKNKEECIVNLCLEDTIFWTFLHDSTSLKSTFVAIYVRHITSFRNKTIFSLWLMTFFHTRQIYIYKANSSCWLCENIVYKRRALFMCNISLSCLF